MKYRMIDRCREAFPIRLMCRCLRVSVSGYYGWATRPPSRQTQENTRLLSRIRHLHAEADGVSGSRRIWEDLRYVGERCGRQTTQRLTERFRTGGGRSRFLPGVDLAGDERGDEHHRSSEGGEADAAHARRT